MQRLRLCAQLSALALALAGCSAFHAPMPAQAAPLRGEPLRVEPVYRAEAEPLEIHKIPFQVGVSSATVEKMARDQACLGGQGAGLITPAGPVEVYRMQCDNGKVFMARCEMRQCRPM